MKVRWALVGLLLVAMLALLGCGEADKPAGDEQTGQSVPAKAELRSLEDLSSYRMRVDTASGSGEAAVETDADVEYVREPQAIRVMFSSPQDPSGDTEVVRIGEKTYMGGDMGDGQKTWILTVGDDPDAVDPYEAVRWADAGTYVSDPGCTVAGSEQIDGKATTHYTCGMQVLQDRELIWQSGELVEGSVDAWISDELGVPLKVTAAWSTKDEEGQTLEEVAEASLGEVDVALTITAPEGEGVPVIPTDVPVHPQAGSMMIMTDSMFYDVKDATLADVQTFFRDEMAAAGWEVEMDAEGMMTFTKGEQSATLMLTEDEGAIAVTLLIE
ncbi:MAG: hypothetical protein ACOX2L_02940 [Anaerolineae bacterium]|jgi:hypothetical protein|nr:hypothetical protein [Chloroflexota bacterium]